MSEYKKALVIDDDPLTTQLIKEILESEGYECQISNDIKSIGQCAEIEKYEIFFIDLMLDGLEGIDLIAKIRQQLPEAIILAVTGLSATEHLRNVIKAGADHYFNKPVNAKLLLERLRSLIARINDQTLMIPLAETVLNSLKNARNPVFITDKDGNLFFANTSFLNLTGLSADRVTRYNLRNLRLENSEEFQKLLQRCKKGMTETRMLETRFNQDKRNESWFNVIINPINNALPDDEMLFLIFMYDITRKKQMDYFILNNEEKFRSFISLSNDGMALINDKGQVIEWNNTLTEITGISMQRVYGEFVWEILSWAKVKIRKIEVSGNSIKKFIQNALTKGLAPEKQHQDTCQIIHADGHKVYLQYSLFTIKVDRGYRLGMVIRDNTATITYQNRIKEQKAKLEEAYQEMEKLARIDPLTQIANRRDIEIKLNYEITRFYRHHHPLCIAIADIDDFKKFNDTYGHDMGDYILAKLADLMKQTIRAQDILGRWGGEEFILIFPETDLEGGEIITQRIREQAEKFDFCFKDISTHLTLTIGISQFQKDDSIDNAVKRADNALYIGKKSGKNCVITAKQENNEE